MGRDEAGGARAALARRLVDGEAPTADDAAALAALRRPVYVLGERLGDPAHAASLSGAFGAPVFEAGDVALFRVPLAGPGAKAGS